MINDEYERQLLTQQYDAEIQRLASMRMRLEEDRLRTEVIAILESQGYTVIPPGGAVPR